MIKMSWQDILKNDGIKEWTLYLEYYTKHGYSAPQYDREHKFTGTEEEAIEFAEKTKEPWEDDLMDFSTQKEIRYGNGTWTLVTEDEDGTFVIEENGEREYEEK